MLVGLSTGRMFSVLSGLSWRGGVCGWGKGWLVAGSVVCGTLLGPEATGAGFLLGMSRTVVWFVSGGGLVGWCFWFSWALPLMS